MEDESKISYRVTARWGDSGVTILGLITVSVNDGHEEKYETETIEDAQRAYDNFKRRGAISLRLIEIRTDEEEIIVAEEVSTASSSTTSE